MDQQSTDERIKKIQETQQQLQMPSPQEIQKEMQLEQLSQFIRAVQENTRAQKQAHQVPAQIETTLAKHDMQLEARLSRLEQQLLASEAASTNHVCVRIKDLAESSLKYTAVILTASILGTLVLIYLCS